MTQDETRWISVEDELPPKGVKPVLVYAGNNMIVGRYYRVSGWRSEETMRPICNCSTHKVTHWRPLPAPPEVDLGVVLAEPEVDMVALRDHVVNPPSDYPPGFNVDKET